MRIPKVLCQSLRFSEGLITDHAVKSQDKSHLNPLIDLLQLTIIEQAANMLLGGGHLSITHCDSSSTEPRSSGGIIAVKVPHAMLSIETKLLKNKTQVLGS